MDNLIPADASISVFDPIKGLSDIEKKAIIRPAFPPYGIAGFLFDIPQDESVELTSNITDHYVEDNTTINDNIGLAPEVVTVKGLIGELVSTSKEERSQGKLSNPLAPIAGLFPQVTPGAQANVALKEYERQLDIESIAGKQSLSGFYDALGIKQPNQTRQSAVFGYFHELWKSRQLFSVETPWGMFTSMAIQSIRALQLEDTRFYSEFIITFKRFNFAQEANVNDGQLAGRAGPQSATATRNTNAGQSDVSDQQRASFLLKYRDPIGLA